VIVQVTIDRVADEGEDEAELEKLPFGCGQTAAQFEYDPTSGERWKYLYDLQEALFQLFRHELAKAEEFQEAEDNKDG